jgi:hypothetical protein
MFFEVLFALVSNEQEKFKVKIGVINISTKTNNINNQAFDTDNFEAFYYYLCILLKSRIELNKEHEEQYLSNLRHFLSQLNVLKNYKTYESYNEEKNNINKFLIICFAILNLDYQNNPEIFQLIEIFDTTSNDKKKDAINFCLLKMKRLFKPEIVTEFENKININDINISLNYKNYKNKIKISESSYLYHYIIKNNIYKIYEKEIIGLLKVIYKSDLIKYLCKALYPQKMKYIFEEENFVENLWKKIIIFVPFKIKSVSGFTYREFFKIFISIYKICYFNSEIEDIILTFGSFIRTLIHESLGHLFISYIFFMFYANQREKEYINYNSPRIIEQMESLDKVDYIEFIGIKLAEIANSILKNEKNDLSKNENENEQNYMTLPFFGY